MPCQDTPALKCTYDARLRVAEGIRALMSALMISESQLAADSTNDRPIVEYAFEQKVSGCWNSSTCLNSPLYVILKSRIINNSREQSSSRSKHHMRWNLLSVLSYLPNIHSCSWQLAIIRIQASCFNFASISSDSWNAALCESLNSFVHTFPCLFLAILLPVYHFRLPFQRIFWQSLLGTLNQGYIFLSKLYATRFLRSRNNQILLPFIFKLL